MQKELGGDRTRTADLNLIRGYSIHIHHVKNLNQEKLTGGSLLLLGNWLRIGEW